MSIFGDEGMNRIITHSAVIFACAGMLASAAFPANWYVDNAASGNNTGASWEHAWTSFDNIRWGAGGVKGGDTIFISGGSSSKTYHEQLVIMAAVTIRPGQERAHHGVVVIDGKGAISPLVDLQAENIVIDGEYKGNRHIQLQNAGKLVTGDNRGGIKILHCELNDGETGIHLIHPRTGTVIAHNFIHDITEDAAIRMGGSEGGWDAHLIHDNTIFVNVQASGTGPDAIRLSGSTSIYNNVIKGIEGKKITGSQHSDGVQALGAYMKVYNNEIVNMSNCGIFIDQLGKQGGYGRVYNNLVYLTASWPGYARGIQFKTETGCDLMDDVRIYNNTVVDFHGYYGIYLKLNQSTDKVTNCEIKNNLVYNCKGIRADAGDYQCGRDLVIDCNLVHAGPRGRHGIVCGDGNYAQQHGPPGAPTFVRYAERSATNDFHLAAEDRAARNNGANLSPYFTHDLEGNRRPHSQGWDIGAYQYGTDNRTGNRTPLRPPANVNVER
jgi:hypothetical protein